MTSFRHQMRTALLLSGLLAATIMFFEPIKSAASNWSEIGTGFPELIGRLAAPFAAVFAAVALFGSILVAAMPRRAIPILVAFYVTLWAQGSVFIWEYGSFDGSPIEWNALSRNAWFEVAFWAAALALALIQHEWIRRRAIAITAIVFALQLAALADLIGRNAPYPLALDSEASVAQGPGAESVSLFSRERNVIIIVLDGLQSDFFSQAMRDPQLLSVMPPGFTYYRNATSAYAKTGDSLRSMLTSKTIDGVRWSTRMTQSLPAQLSDQGFGGLITSFSSYFRTPRAGWGYQFVSYETLAEAGSTSAEWRKDTSDMFALGIFRLSPHVLKPYIYDDGRWQIRRLFPQREVVSRDPKILEKTRTDLAVFDQIIASASSGDTAPQFRLLHFFGTHRPFTVDRDCGYNSTGTHRELAIATTHCILSRLYEFLNKLDEIGVYDQSLILVLADHGSWDVPLDLSASAQKIPRGRHSIDTGREMAPKANWHGRGVPAFLAKPFRDRQALRISDVPVALCDVPKSVFDALSLESDFGCDSIFEAQDVRQTPRAIHYRDVNDVKIRTRLGLSPKAGEEESDKFSIEGHSWRLESWIQIGTNTD
jgi:hypothetical protein